MICGKCGHPERDSTIEPDENGNCGVCGADNWIEWNDFKMGDLKDYVEEAADHLNISIAQLVVKVYKSLQEFEYKPRVSKENKKKRIIYDVFRKFEI